MKDFLNSVKEDLVDPRLRVLVAVVLVAVVAAVAYAKLGSSSPTSTPPASSPAPAATTAAPPTAAAVPAANPNAAVAETTYGKGDQHHGKLSNPFTALPTEKSKTTTVATLTSSSATSTAAAPVAPSSPTTHTTTTSAPAAPVTPAAPVKPATHIAYRVTVELGPAPATAAETPHLTVYKNVKVGQSLPSKSHPLVVLKRAVTNGKALLAGKPDTSSATFTLTGFNPPIVSGPGACLPTATQCEAIQLDSNVPEELQFAEPNGQTVTYLLKLTLVDPVKVTG